MATHIKYLIEDFFKKRRDKHNQQKTIEEITDNFLQEELKQHIYLQKISQNKIVFSSDSSGATYNLNLIKEDLLLEIQKKFPEIKRITIQTARR